MRTHSSQTFLFISIKDVVPPIVQDLIRRREGPVAVEIVRHGGRVFDVGAQQIRAVFEAPRVAVEALVAAQQKLAAFTLAYNGIANLAAAIHHGPCVVTGTSYEGEPLRYARYLLAAAHPGQYLLSEAACEALDDGLPSALALRDLGEQRLKDLTRARRVVQLARSSHDDSFPPLHTLDRRPHNLPVLASSLVGRDPDVVYLAGLLTRPEIRMVSLLGPSGTGKSRLSQQVMAELLETFEHGCFFVSLAAIDTGELLLPAIAQAVGVRASPSRPMIETLKAALSDRQLLLVLDNFEQLVEHALVVGELLAAAPQLKVIVTTQIALGLPQEQVVPLPPLGLPSSARFAVVENLIRFPAVALFAERARSNYPDFEVTLENADAVAAICLHLEGLPLAIELVAAYSDLFSPQAILTQLQSRLLTAPQHGGQVVAQAQQRTLRTVLEWSFDLLGPAEQALFARLGVFVGGGTVAQVVQLCAQDADPGEDTSTSVVRQLEVLLKRNLLLRDGGDDGHLDRWRMLDMVHDYAEKALAQRPEAVALADRHASYFLQFLLAVEHELTGPGQAERLNQLEREYPNLRAALRRFYEQGQIEEALRWIGGAWKFWQFRGYHTEARFWTERILAQARQVAVPSAELLAARAKALYGTAWLRNDQADYDTSLLLFEESVALAEHVGDERSLGMALQGVGAISQLQGDVERARTSFERARAVFLRLGDQEESAWVLDHLGLLERRQGNLETAEQAHIESVALFKAVGHVWGLALAFNHLARALLEQGKGAEARALLVPWIEERRRLGTDQGSDYYLTLAALGEAEMYVGNLEQAEQIFEACMAECRKTTYAGRMAMLYDNLGRLAIRQGNHAKARQAFCESLRLQQELKELWRIIQLLGWVAELAVAEQEWAFAAQLTSSAAALREANGSRLAGIQEQMTDETVVGARHALGDEAFEACWAHGQGLTLAQILETASARLCEV